jgi:hypothetical protein
MRTALFTALTFLLLVIPAQSANEGWIEIATWGERHVFYDKDSVITISQDEKEVIICVSTTESSIMSQTRITMIAIFSWIIRYQ